MNKSNEKVNNEKAKNAGETYNTTNYYVYGNNIFLCSNEDFKEIMLKALKASPNLPRREDVYNGSKGSGEQPHPDTCSKLQESWAKPTNLEQSSRIGRDATVSINHTPSTINYTPSTINYTPLSSPDDQRVREALMAVCSRISRQRYWFCIYRGLVDRGLIPENNFKYFRNYIISLLGKDNLPRSIDFHDLQFKMNVLSFAKPLELWDKDNSPVTPNVFDVYYSLTFDFMKLL